MSKKALQFHIWERRERVVPLTILKKNCVFSSVMGIINCDNLNKSNMFSEHVLCDRHY